jgi:fructose-bisphosphate aldolase class II
MIDGSHQPYDKNIELTKKVVEYAHSRLDYVSVE